MFQLTDAHVEELDAALVHAEAHVRRRARHHAATTFPLPTLGAELAGITASSSTARVSCSSAACPSSATARQRASSIYWGVGTHLGRPWPQNAKGHLLGDVTDQGKAADDPTSRGNEIGGIAFPFHSDGSDLVGLFCLDAGASGGASLVANALTIHNELARTEPELAAELYAPFPYDFRGEQAPGAQAVVHDADLQPARRPAVRALHPPVHRVDASPRRRAPPVRRGARGDEPGRRDVRRSRSTTCR